MIITSNCLSGKLLISTSLGSSSGVFSCSFASKLPLCCLILPVFSVFVSVLGRSVTVLDLGKVTWEMFHPALQERTALW